MNSTANLEQHQHRAFTMAHASHQDQLVQHYRLLLASFELATVAVVFAISSCLQFTAALQLGLLAVVLWTHRKVGNGFRQAIEFRQKDVDWAQAELMLAETCLSSSFRTFTRFKVYQDRDKATLDAKQALFLSDERQAMASDISTYFFSHSSKSRGKAALLLAHTATSVRLFALAVALQQLLLHLN